MRFYKMNGCGNAFAIFDAREKPLPLTAEAVRAIASPDGGAGCDQVIVMEPPVAPSADVFMRIYNADGSEVSACGNATRCVAWLVLEETGGRALTIETAAGLLHAEREAAFSVAVDMGAPRLNWDEIPLAERMDTRGIDIKIGPIDKPYLSLPGAVSMGNPHAVFFVDDVEAINIPAVGPLIEGHMLFPEGVNVGFAQILTPEDGPNGKIDRIRLRVWERGAGLTLACGTGACAALVAAHRRRLVGRVAKLVLDGGELLIDWRTSDDHVIMTGPIMLEYKGEMPG